MKKLFIIYFVLCTSFFSVLSYAKSSTQSQSLDQIVAVVNDDVVTKSELNHALAMIKMQIAQEKVEAPSENKLQKTVLDQLINKKLQLQLAKQAGIQISEGDLDKAIGNVAKLNNMSVTELYQRLDQEGMSSIDYRNEMRDQLTLHKLQQQEIASRITLSPQEVSRFIQSQSGQDKGPKEYRVEDILIPLTEDPTTDEITAAKKNAESILAKLNQGQNLQTLIKAEAGKPHPLASNDLGFLKLSEIPSAFADQVTKMHAKEVAGPIQAGNGFHLIRLTAIRATDPSEKTTPKRQEAEHLLFQRKFEEALQDWVSKMRSQAFVVVNLA